MTVMFFSRLFYPHIGGVEKHVLEISKILIKKGYKITVIAEQHHPKLKLHDAINTSLSFRDSVASRDIPYDNYDPVIEIYRIPVHKDDRFKKFRIWAWLWKHRNLIKEADVVHCHDVFFWYLPFRFLFPKKPIYTTFHGYEYYPISKKALIVRKISEKLSNGNICVGDFIRKWYGTKPSYITYGGVELSERTGTSRINRKKLKIVFIGRLEKDIGIELYSKTLDILKQKKIRFDITFLGKGKYKKVALRYGIVNENISYDMNYYGIVLRDADVIFASSYLSILRALAASKLVFSIYDNPLKKDYLTMTPFAKWIVIEKKPKDLADKILYFMSHDGEKEEIIKEAHKWARAQTWEKATEMYIKLWDSRDKYH